MVKQGLNKTGSVMVPPGYKLTLYSQDAQRGEEEGFWGAYEQGQRGDSKVKCQQVETLINGNEWHNVGISAKSMRIVKNKEGQATGYWKGITTSEKQKFTYQVGLSSKDETSTK